VNTIPEEQVKFFDKFLVKTFYLINVTVTKGGVDEFAVNLISSQQLLHFVIRYIFKKINSFFEQIILLKVKHFCPE
jgi:hypothetical protein